MMKVDDFCNTLTNIVSSVKTIYVKGCFGSPMNANNIKRYTQNNAYNIANRSKISKASDDTFGFDCVCLIKGILWGWSGNKNHAYGGATYLSNDVPDITADTMINKCTNISTDFNEIVKGALVWIKGHVGVYVGDGYVVECTPTWDGGVQMSILSNTHSDKGVPKARKWSKWGKLPYVDYEQSYELKLKVDNAIQTVDGFIKNGRTYVWLRDLSDILGYSVTYDEVKKLPGIITK